MKDPLSKKEKEVLKELDEVHPASLKKDVLLDNLGYKQNEILADIKRLEENSLINTTKALDESGTSVSNDEFPAYLTITLKGKKKLEENFFKRLWISAYNNPWPAITVIIMLVLGIIASYYYFENNQLEQEKAILEKPLLITPDIRAVGGSVEDFTFVVKNPSHSVDYYYVSGTCKPDDPSIFTSPLKEEKEKENTGDQNTPEKPSLVAPIQINQDIPIPAGKEITLFCSNNYVKNPSKDMITHLNVCVDIRNIQDQICNRMQVTILKS